MRRTHDSYWDEERHQLYNIMSQRLIACWTLIGFVVLFMLYVNLENPGDFLDPTFSLGCLMCAIAIIPASLMSHYADSVSFSSLKKGDKRASFQEAYDLNLRTKACFHATIGIIIAGAFMIAASSRYMLDLVAVACTIFSILTTVFMSIAIHLTMECSEGSGKNLKMPAFDLKDKNKLN